MEITRGKISGAQKILVYGPEGIGKSTFASQFPNPVFIDTEGSTKHMDVLRTPKPSSWTMIKEQVAYFKANPYKCDTLVMDTADWAEQLCKVEVCAKGNKKSIADFGYGNGFIYLADEFGKLLNSFEELIDLGINVVITAHAQMRKFEQPDEMGSYDRWEMKLEKKVFPLLKEWADMVLFANYETYVVKTEDKKNKAQGGKRIMYTSHHPCWDAKNRHNLEVKLPFDYISIAHCIITRGAAPIQQLRPQQAITPTPAVEQTKVTVVPPVMQSKPAEKPKEILKVNTPEPPKNDLKGIPKALADLMKANNVTVEEIQEVVGSRGYYPKNTPIDNYDPSFVAGVLVGAWQQVYAMITESRDLFVPVMNDNE